MTTTGIINVLVIILMVYAPWFTITHTSAL